MVFDWETLRVSLRHRVTGREQRSFATRSREEAGWNAYLSPDGKTVLIGTMGKAVRAWDVATGKELPPLEGPRSHGRLCALGRYGRTLLTTGEDPFVLVWDWPARKQRGRIELGAGRRVEHLAISADGKRAEIVCSDEHALRFFDLESGKELPSAEGHRGEVRGLAITADHKVVSAGLDSTIRTWDLSTGQPLHVHATEHARGLASLAVSGDGRLVATYESNHGTVAIHDRDTGRQVRTIDLGLQEVSSLTFAPEGQLLAFTGYRRGPNDWLYSLVLWDAGRGQELRRLEGTKWYSPPAFSPDGRLLAVACGDQVRLLEVTTGQQRTALPRKDVHVLAFSPDGKTLACADQEGILLWELATCLERARIEVPPGLTRVLHFSPDGRWLAWGVGNILDDESEAVHLWDVWRGEKVRPLLGHDRRVTGLAFAPDGRTLVSCSSDTTLLVWDLTGVAAWQPRPASRPDAAALGTAWNDLAGRDAKAAYQALQVLASAPAQSVAFLRERLRPAPPLDRKQVERWLADLDSDEFAQREKAVRELERLGERVEAPLRRLLAGSPSAEARRRAEELLAGIEGPVSNAERLQQLRAVELLERIGKEVARELLKALAEGDPEAPLTRDAAAAFRRLGRRP